LEISLMMKMMMTQMMMHQLNNNKFINHLFKTICHIQYSNNNNHLNKQDQLHSSIAMMKTNKKSHSNTMPHLNSNKLNRRKVQLSLVTMKKMRMKVSSQYLNPLKLKITSQLVILQVQQRNLIIYLKMMKMNTDLFYST
jgi:hypothetical protein